MTREEAIKSLQNFADHAYPNEEFVMAIKALEQEPCEDCISRQAAKRIIFDEFEGWPTDEEVAQLKRLTRQFDSLPSVTPKEPKTEWISVRERLPEICEENANGNITFSKIVLSCRKYGDGFIYVGNDQCTINGSWLSEVPFDNPNECCKVIAWMPLPEPYKESKE